MANILVFGASGQLGTCLKQVAAERNNLNLSYPPEGQGNILDLKSLSQLFETEKPKFVINCAAYTAVDKAEDEVDLSREVNRDGPGNLAQLCKEHLATLIHISTDFVFEGNLPKLLSEDDATAPINIYGLTKLEGERAIADTLARHYIIRTSWLYSEHGNNFVKTMLRLGAERDELRVIVDQVGTPTYAVDLAGAILDIIDADTKAYGVYHYSNEGAVSWYDFAKAIFEISNTKVVTHPIPSSEFLTKARRPSFSVMDKSKLRKTFGIDVPYWRDSLKTCILKLSKQ